MPDGWQQVYKAALLAERYSHQFTDDLRRHLGYVHVDGGPLRVDLRDGSRVVDRGDRLEASGRVTDVTVRAMLELARAHGWKTLEFTGDQDFQRRAATAATRAGFEVSNPDLQQIVLETRQQMQREADDQRRLDGAIQAARSAPQPSSSEWRVPLSVETGERRLATYQAAAQIRDDTIRAEVLRNLAGDRLSEAVETLRAAHADLQRAQDRAASFHDRDEPGGLFARRVWRREREDAAREAQKAKEVLRTAEATHGAVVRETEASPEYRDAVRQRIADREHARGEVIRLEEWLRQRRPAKTPCSAVDDAPTMPDPDPIDDLPTPG